MRIAWLACLGLVACGDSSRVGLYLQLTDPTKGSADTVEVIIAGAPTLIEQRTSDLFGAPPGSTAIPYYVQRASTGPVPGPLALDGYTLLLEPDPAVDGTALVPIVIARRGTTISSVGVVPNPGPDAVPTAAPIAMRTGRAEIAVVPMLATTVATDGQQPVPGQLAEYDCTAASAGSNTPSGLVWYDGSGRELRLVLPAAGATDAAARPLDIDCDQIPAGSGATDDCNDLSAAIHPGAGEPSTCDGIDYSCTMDTRYVVVPCTDTASGCGSGRAICDETNPTAPRQCITAACSGAAFETCNDPITQQGQGTHLCSPAAGPLTLPDPCSRGTCLVRVVKSPPTVQAALSAHTNGANPGPMLTVQAGGTAVLVIASNAAAQPGPVGQVDLLVIDSTGAPTFLGVLLDATDTGGSCDNPVTGMQCAPPQALR